MQNNKYSIESNFTKYARRYSQEVNVGEVTIGGQNPILVQSMATVDTNNCAEATKQAMDIFSAGAKAVRFTAQGVREAVALKNIREQLNLNAVTLPLIADIHFNHKAAFEAAQNVEKVRINPGNFIGNKSKLEYSDSEYEQELLDLKDVFTQFLKICKEHKTAIRIGVNHGSLSERIMSKHGDTPEGMSLSAMEFLRICKNEKFNNVVVSMKSSNTVTMVIACRMLCKAMSDEQMNYPIHLGVTEAGEGSDGRVRSAVGIGALLNDGIGDTIRVSLTENPVNEIEVAQCLVDYYKNRDINFDGSFVDFSIYNPFGSNKSNNNFPFVIFDISNGDENADDYLSKYPEDYVYIGDREIATQNERVIASGDSRLYYATLDNLKTDKIDKNRIIIVEANSPQYHRAVAIYIMQRGIKNLVVVKKSYSTTLYDKLQVWAAADFGGLLIDGFFDGVWISGQTEEKADLLPLSILQSSRRRVSKAEYISCPGCGRTLYDLQSVVKELKERTSELKSIKIAIMGCIVNGPGEMADADYGYVGAGKGVVTLYKGKNVVEQNIPQQDAIERLIELIKINGDWR